MTTEKPAPVILETPYAGDVSLHLRYLRACMNDCLVRGEAPFASHGLYTQPGVLRDELWEDRERGITAGYAWRYLARTTVFYADLGWSSGMERAREEVTRLGLGHEVRHLGEGWLEKQLAREVVGTARRHWYCDDMSSGEASR